jgi:ribose transport system ATP-binding protein
VSSVQPSSQAPLPPALRVETIWKAFGATQALAAVSFSVERGSIHALLGGNGSGKSTLIKVLAGVQPADAGRVDVGDKSWDAAAATPAVARSAGLRFVHQDPSTFAALTVAENLHIGSGFETGRAGRIKWREVRRRSEQLLDRFQIDARPDQQVSELGRATRTMVAIARALQDQGEGEGGVLVLDEPTSSLPTDEVDLLFGALRRYAKDGQTILFVSHRLDEVMDIADRSTVLRDGRFVGTVERAEMTEDRLIELMIGRSIVPHSSERQSASSDQILLSCEELSGGAMRSVTFTLRRGEILGIAGLLGSGRSTLLRALFGLVTPDGGRVVLDGQRVDFDSAKSAMAAGIAYVPEDRVREAAFLELPVAENISMPALKSYWHHGVFKHAKERADARQAMADFTVKAESERVRFGSLSGGNQQKAVLARWLRLQPRILLLDEPTQGVDVAARAELYTLVRRAAQAGTSILVVSTEFEELEHLCDRALVMQRGQITAELLSPNVTSDRLEQLVHTTPRSDG